MVLAILVGACGFIVVAIGVRAGVTRNLDEMLLRAPREPGDPVRTVGPAWLEESGKREHRKMYR
jgi:hypothetical protein